jgi:uncharacterized cofD-like protein
VTETGHVAGQTAVAATSRLERVLLEPAHVSAPEAVPAAILAADVVVLGPGSLYTSILPNLLVPDVADAVRDTRARVVLVANLREQPGETEGMTLADHLDALHAHVPGLRIDVVVGHRGSRPAGPGRALDPADALGHPLVGEVVTGELADGVDGHDPASLAAALARLVTTVPDR